jgi:Zn-dependent M16 (insulinase) family peptidase
MAKNFGFELLRDEQIPEINSRVLYYRHRKTGARLLSLVNDDENKVFGITFRTPPADSTGIAHIMEHSVLCGSRKYPVKEPFVELMKGSLNTFLNAMTYPDKTCYPVASTNLQDFYNLVDVYLDAVLYPRISEEILQQEGWHYELNDVHDPLIYKGVVFNEMKGAYSSPDRIISKTAQQSVFPDTTYATDSGGDPKHIPELTYENFKEFHRSYYHPSNSFIFFYGDDDPTKRLEILNEYLRDYEFQACDSAVPIQPRFEQTKKIMHKYYAGKETGGSNKGVVSVNWLMSDSLNPKDRFRLRLLDHVLLGNPAAPLWKALIDSGLGEDLSTHGLSGGLRQSFFSSGLRGIAPEIAEKVETLLFQTLQKLSEEGIEKEIIESSLNTIEFQLRENNTGSTPRGLTLMLRSLSTWLYDGDPIAPLKFEETLASIKKELADDPRLLEKLIRFFFLENQHRATVILEPDESLAEKDAAEEKKRLEKTRSSMSPDDSGKLVETTKRLKLIQTTADSPDDLAKIPRLGLEDLEKLHKPIPIEVFRHGDTEILHHDLFTSNIVYLDVGFDLRQVPPHLLPYLGLFGRALLELGTEKEDFVKLSRRIGKNTGGIWKATLSAIKNDRKNTVARFFLSGKALVSQTPEMLEIFKDILLIPRLDNRERFRQILLDTKSGKEDSLAANGSGLVSTRIEACFNEIGWLGEQLGGVRSVFFIRELLKKVENDWSSVLAALEALRRALINRNGIIVNVTVDGDNWSTIQPQLHAFLGTLPESPLQLQNWNARLYDGFDGFSIPAKVNFVGKGANLYKLGYSFHGSAMVIQNLLRTNWLWNRVRVEGGAYGAFCQFDRRSGMFKFISYRDPNLLKTVENYDKAGKYLRETDISGDELVKNIIGTIGDIDAYQLPDRKGYTSMFRYLVGVSDDELQKIRDEVLSTTPTHMKEFADVLDALKEQGLVVAAGSEETLLETNAAKNNWLKITKVL